MFVADRSSGRSRSLGGPSGNVRGGGGGVEDVDSEKIERQEEEKSEESRENVVKKTCFIVRVHGPCDTVSAAVVVGSLCLLVRFLQLALRNPLHDVEMRHSSSTTPAAAINNENLVCCILTNTIQCPRTVRPERDQARCGRQLGSQAQQPQEGQ